MPEARCSSVYTPCRFGSRALHTWSGAEGLPVAHLSAPAEPSPHSAPVATQTMRHILHQEACQGPRSMCSQMVP
jgi:hypothetical protein